MEDPWVLVKGRPFHPFQWFCETALSFLWLIFFFLLYFEGYFLLVLESKIFCLCWHEVRGTPVLNEKGSVVFWEQSEMILYLVGWSSTKSLLWKVVIWFCSVAAEQTILWFSIPRPLSLRATAIARTLPGSLQLFPRAELTAGQQHFRHVGGPSGESMQWLLHILLLASASWEPAGKTDWEAFNRPKCSNSETNVSSILIQPSSELWSPHTPLFPQAHPNTAPCGGWSCCWGWLVCFYFFSEAYWFVSSPQMKIKYVCPVCFLSS